MGDEDEWRLLLVNSTSRSRKPLMRRLFSHAGHLCWAEAVLGEALEVELLF